MRASKKYIAIDLGAESGRVIMGSVSDDRLVLETLHRFLNRPVSRNNCLKWDLENIVCEVQSSLRKCIQRENGQISGVGVDSWNVDFALFDSADSMINSPYHYRDKRTEGMMELAAEIMSDRELYEITGQQFLRQNTLYQLLAMRQAHSSELTKAASLLFISGLFQKLLCGAHVVEYTTASTSQLLDIHSGAWSEQIFEQFNLPVEIMPEVVNSGTVIGELNAPNVWESTLGSIPVIAVGSHDTASAVAAVPSSGQGCAFISSGTWSALGAEISEPLIGDTSFEFGFGNEGGVANTFRFLHNVMGLWLIQECKKQWQMRGEDITYEQMMKMASKAEPFAAYIDPDFPGFFGPSDMPVQINSFLNSTAQRPVNDKAQIIRIVLESLAFKYRFLLDRLERCTGRSVEVIHIIGGGADNNLLCQMTADATGRRVVAGPREATAVGNILMQAIAGGQLSDLNQGRAIVAKSFDLKLYEPGNSVQWDDHYESFERLLCSRANLI